MSRNLDRLFRPSSVAVVGASNNKQKLGAIILKSLIESGYLGNIYPINPKETSILRLPCYSIVTDLPQSPDLILIALPADLVPNQIELAGKIKAGGVVVYSAGFSESGEDGRVLQDQIKLLADKYSLPILGPNCLGFANLAVPINATFGKLPKTKGSIRLISQSGAIATGFFDWCNTTDLGLQDFVSIGNKVNLGEEDILEYFDNHQVDIGKTTNEAKVTPIGLYLESISDGEKLINIASKISSNNPIFALKPGKSSKARQAMQSHTGALAGEDSILETAFTKAGILRCDDLGEFFHLARALSWENAPLGPEVAVVSNAGGPAVLVTDQIEKKGLKVAEFSEQTNQMLAKILPRMASFHNPVDVLGDALANRFDQALDIVLAEKQVNSVIVILTPQLMTQISATAKIIGKYQTKYRKTILCSFIGGDTTKEGEEVLNKNRIPSLPFPEMAVNILAKMWQWQNWKNNQIIKSNSSNKTSTPKTKDILKLNGSEIMSLIGINTPASQYITDQHEANSFVSTYKFPVVMKIISQSMLHKTEAGGVITEINDYVKLEESWKKLKANTINLNEKWSIEIQKEIQNGVEVIIGIKKDPNFGSVLLFGAGGKYAELMEDRNLLILPVNDIEIKQLIEKSKVFKFLNGYRNGDRFAIEKLTDAVIKLTQSIQYLDQIKEIEINPLIVTKDNVYAVDPKVIFDG